MPAPGLRERKIYGTPVPTKEENRPSRKEPSKKWLKKIITLLVFLALAGFVGATSFVLYISRELPDPEKISDRQVAQSTKIYDRTGSKLLYEVYQDQKRTVVDLKDISPWVVKSTIIIEDKHFYTHSGIRVVSIIRAQINNLLGRKTGGGGASTLTQQLIKNALVGNERSYFRKIKEAILAIRLEQKFDKDQILKMYLNEIPYGSTNYGIEAAAQSYLKKSSRDLTLAEAAMLASIPQRPSRYLNDFEALKARRDYILKLLRDDNQITATEYEQAVTEEIRLDKTSGILAAPHFVLYIRQLLADKYGEKAVDSGGFKVITTLDLDKQLLAEKIISEQGEKFATESNANNASLVAMDPKTGQILSMVGSRDFENKEINGQYNVATLGRRQPGSSFKPFVYAFAFEKGYTPETVLYDVITNFDRRTGSEYTPKNYDGKEYGLVTMRKALQGSLNIPAVKTLYLVGVNETIEFARRFGYTTFTGDYGLSLVLGGGEVKLLEHTNAYATLANNGVYNEPVSILKIIDNTGKIIEEWKPREGTKAVEPEVAATITNVLSDNSARAYIFGLNSTLFLADRPVAAKTGTTNDNKDAWTMGYTPSLVTGVWVGNTKPSPMKAGGNKLAGVIFNQFMKETLAGTPAENFPTPPENDSNKPILNGTDGGVLVKVNRFNGKIATSSTPPELIESRLFAPPHDILHYVDKNDPRGAEPDNPGKDSQYQNWEDALLEWVQRQQTAGITVDFTEPPIEYDNNYNPELIPTINFIYPTDGMIINNRQIQFQIEASAPRGVASVYYYLDNTRLGYTNDYPFSLTAYISKVGNGEHTLRTVALDDQGNAGSEEIKIFLMAESEPASFEFKDVSPLVLTKTEFPYKISIAPFKWEEIKEIKIYLKGPGTDKLIYTFDKNDKLDNGQISFTWRNFPGAGNWVLEGKMTDNSGKTYEAKLEIVATL
ncbi:MAG TPA: PBP1A family penicillin-binding protein [Candidatus Magasanikbacteria bacterium]|nr:PBP1A family penicillin-binding protein [Candidatus Magasanikbacteria bacterium]